MLAVDAVTVVTVVVVALVLLLLLTTDQPNQTKPTNQPTNQPTNCINLQAYYNDHHQRKNKQLPSTKLQLQSPKKTRNNTPLSFYYYVLRTIVRLLSHPPIPPFIFLVL